MPLRCVRWGVLHTKKGVVVPTPYNGVSTRYSPLIPTPQIAVLAIPKSVYPSVKGALIQGCFRISATD